MKKVICLLVMSISTIQLTAQETDFSISVNPDTVAVGQRFTVKFTIENLKGDIDIMDWDESLAYYGQPSISNRTSIINDVMTQSKEYVFTVQATKAGIFLIQGKFKVFSSGEMLERQKKIVVLDKLPEGFGKEKPQEDMQFRRRDQNELPITTSKKKRKIYRL